MNYSFLHSHIIVQVLASIKNYEGLDIFLTARLFLFAVNVAEM